MVYDNFLGGATGEQMSSMLSSNLEYDTAPTEGLK